jgi:uncharacterized membrane protein
MSGSSGRERDTRRDARGPRLDVPRETRRQLVRRPQMDADTFGRFAETFDDYPFIFLTLMLSLQASYAAPLILLAQNRQEDRDRVIAEQDRTANTRAHADMEFLAREMASLRMALGEVATRDYVRSELRSLMQELEETRRQDEDGDEHA